MRRRQPKPRRPWQIFLLALALLLAAGLFFYDQQTRIETQTLTVAAANLPAAFNGFRIAVVSDLHGKEFGVENEILLRKVAAQKPDIIAITGDIIDQASQLHIVLPVARGLAAIAPTYYVTGNHEWAARAVKAVKALMGEAGVTVLTNDYLTLERDGQTMVLAGIDDPNGPYDQTTPTELAEEIRTTCGDAFLLLLAHRNEDYNTYDRAGFDLTLCGHAHGGLIRLPFTDGLLGNDRRFFPDHTAGLYELSYGTLAVSRGLGNNTVPIPSFRLFNRPHLPIIELVSKE